MHESGSRPSLRLWPGVIIAIVLVLVRYVVPAIAPGVEMFELPISILGLGAGMLAAVAIVLWWLLFSRAPWSERLGTLALLGVVLFATSLVVHESIAGGAMGRLLYVLAIPTVSVALVAGAVAGHRRSRGGRWAAMIVCLAIGSGLWALVRTNGVVGDALADLEWRWTPTAEERLLAQAPADPAPPAPAPPPVTIPSEPRTDAANTAPVESPPAAPAGAADGTEPSTPASATAPAAGAAAAVPSRAEWPGFRGPRRDSVIRGVRIATDWTSSPPVEMWRRPIGPGWSSFAVHGDLLYTQEQRGEDEIVSCYRVSTGEPVWRHRDPVRFWESNGGAGPRATPTLHDGRVYAFGATGILNALDASSGTLAWSRNVSTDTGRRIPDWGFASSPLVFDDLVVVAASGTLAAYDLATGDPRWQGPSYGGSYSSPHRATIDGVEQIVLLGGPGALSVDPANGSVLWVHTWGPGPIVQPAMTPDGDILVNGIASTGGIGTRRLHVSHAAGDWSIEERWTSNGLKPYFNDFVVHDGHAFGFDGSILAAIDLEDGTRVWKGGRYGNGQLILLAEQSLLLVVSEDGELALVSATTGGYKELARMPALNSKTWNHPVLVGDILLVRSGEEMAAFRLPLANR